MSEMWARIAAGAVAETTTLEPAGRFHAALSWVPCPAGTEEGDQFTMGAFSRPPPAPPPPAPPALTLAELQAQLATIAAQIAAMTAS